MEPPDPIKNKYKFPAAVVNKAASLLHKWFVDAELGPCRVVEFGGNRNSKGKMEPVLYYTHVAPDGELVDDSSTIPEVASWVAADQSNL
jgi:hypothetical protein